MVWRHELHDIRHYKIRFANPDGAQAAVHGRQTNKGAGQLASEGVYVGGFIRQREQPFDGCVVTVRVQMISLGRLMAVSVSGHHAEAMRLQLLCNTPARIWPLRTVVAVLLLCRIDEMDGCV